jgi:hypothetical protein
MTATMGNGQTECSGCNSELDLETAAFCLGCGDWEWSCPTCYDEHLEFAHPE